MEFNTSNYCVYHHLLNGEVFYVGSGLLKRAFDEAGRTETWKKHSHYAHQYGFGIEVKIVAIFPKKYRKRARLLEKFEIQRLNPSTNIVKSKVGKVPYYLEDIVNSLV